MSDELINQDELDALFNLDGSHEEAEKPEVHESKLQKLASKPVTEASQDQSDGLVSQDDLDALFNLDDDTEQQNNAPQEESSGGDILNQNDLDALLNGDSDEASAPAPSSDTSESSDSSGGDVVSQDDLDALFNLDDDTDQQNNAPQEESSGGNILNQNDLDALLNGDSDEASAPAPSSDTSESSDSSGGDMVSQDELDALFNLDDDTDQQNKAPQEESTGGDILNQDDLDALLNGDTTEEVKMVAPSEPGSSDNSDSGDILGQDELDALFSGGVAEEPAKEEKPAEPVKSEKPIPAKKPEGIVIPDGGDILDQDELDALFSGGASEESVKEEKPTAPVKKEKPAPAQKPEGIVIPDGGDIIDQDELDALFSGGSVTESPTNTTSSSPSGGDDTLTQDDLDSLFNLDDTTPKKSDEPVSAPADGGELISQDELDLLLGGTSSSSGTESKSEVKQASPPPAQTPKPADSKPKVLSQAEIDNMFAGLNLDDDDEEEPVTGTQSADTTSSSTSSSVAVSDYAESAPPAYYDSGGQPSPQKQYKLYNFRRPEKLSRDQIRLMKPHFEPMTRSVTNYLSMQLKTSIDTNFLDIDQINYGDIFRKLDQSDIIGIFKLYPTPHSGILEFSTFLFYSIEERMMGGSGKSHTPIRKITDFEKYLVTDLFENFLSAYGDTIRKFVDTNPRVDMVETDKFLIPRTLSDEEVLVRMVYEIYIDGVSGLLKINIPYSFLSTFFSPFRNKQDASTEKLDSKSMSRNIFSKISVPVSVELKPRKLSVGDLMSLRRGDTIILSHAYEEELGLKVDNNLKYYCKPGISGNKLAVKITRIAEGEEI